MFKSDFDLIIPTDGGWEPALIRLLSWIKRKKMVIVGHSGMGWDDMNNLWSFPDAFIALSTKAKDWAKKINPIVKVIYIPDAVDTSIFNRNGEKRKLKLRKPLVLCVSALEKGKRIDLIIEAVSKTKDVNLLVCGRGELHKKIEKTGHDLLGKRFQLTSFAFSDMPSVYRASDALISASLPYYSFEMVLLEAMACGLPVVTNSDPIRKEIVGNAGILVDVTDANEFSKAIVKIIENNLRDAAVKQAEKFSWDKIISRYSDLFNSLLEGVKK